MESNTIYSSTHFHKNGDSIYISMQTVKSNPEIFNYQTKVYPHTVKQHSPKKEIIPDTKNNERDIMSVESAYNMGTEICSWTFIPDRIQNAPIQSQLGWLAGVLETYGVIGKFSKGNRKKTTNSHKTTINLYLYEHSSQLSKCDDLFIKFVKSVGLFTRLYDGLNTSRPGLQIYGDLLYKMPWKSWKDIMLISNNPTSTSTPHRSRSPTKKRSSLVDKNNIRNYEIEYDEPPGLTQTHYDSASGNNWSTNINIEGNNQQKLVTLHLELGHNLTNRRY